MSLSPTTPAPALIAAARKAAAQPAAPVAQAHSLHLSELHWSRLFLGIAAFVLLAWTIEAVLLRTLEDTSDVGIRLIGAGILTAISGAILGPLARLRREVLHAVATLQFAVALLTVVMLAVMLGTFILQNETLESYHKSYGDGLTAVIFFLGFTDLFHSLWFGGLLVGLALSLVVTIYKHRAWRLPTLGLFLAHFGVITLVFAGMVAYVSGFKGRIDLHEGMAAGSTVLSHHDRDTREQHALGFQLRLDKFEVEKYAPSNKLYLYHRDGASYRRLAAYDAKPTADWRQAQAGGGAFRVQAYYPDFDWDTVLTPAPAGSEQARPGAELTLRLNGAERHRAIGGGAPSTLQLGQDGAAVVFCPAAPGPAELAAWFDAQPAQHLLVRTADESQTPIRVTPGASYQFPADANRIQVLRYLPSFTYNTEAREASSNGAEPTNPAMQITVIGPDGIPGKPMWLFANNPDFTMGGAGGVLPYHYRYQPARKAAGRIYAVVAATNDLWDLRKDHPAVRRPLDQSFDLGPNLTFLSARILPAATLVERPVTLSDQPRNPVVAVEIQDAGHTTVEYLSPDHAAPYTFADHDTILTFETNAGEVKSYRSHVTVLENGLPVLTDVIAVNSPLSYRGYHFYQANYRADDLTYSGFQVVHDPGLPLIWIGLAMISFGVVYNYYIRPRLLGRLHHD